MLRYSRTVVIPASVVAIFKDSGNAKEKVTKFRNLQTELRRTKGKTNANLNLQERDRQTDRHYRNTERDRDKDRDRDCHTDTQT